MLYNNKIISKTVLQQSWYLLYNDLTKLILLYNSLRREVSVWTVRSVRATASWNVGRAIPHRRNGAEAAIADAITAAARASSRVTVVKEAAISSSTRKAG